MIPNIIGRNIKLSTNELILKMNKLEFKFKLSNASL
jgi:hypothetical protein